MGQTNINRSWAWMASYWSVGLLVGTIFGYLPCWTQMANPFTFTHSAAMVATLGIMPRFFEMTTNFGRPSNILSSTIMSICNGICETMIYFAVYDFGAVWLKSILYPGQSTMAKVMGPLLGFLTFSLYSGPIHVLFWFKKWGTC